MRQNAFSFFHSRFEIVFRVQLRGFQNHGVSEIKAQAPLERSRFGCVRHGSRGRRLTGLRGHRGQHGETENWYPELHWPVPPAEVFNVAARPTSLTGYLNIVRSVGLGNE